MNGPVLLGTPAGARVSSRRLLRTIVILLVGSCSGSCALPRAFDTRTWTELADGFFLAGVWALLSLELAWKVDPN
jgi:hypothetical protein